MASKILTTIIAKIKGNISGHDDDGPLIKPKPRCKPCTPNSKDGFKIGDSFRNFNWWEQMAIGVLPCELGLLTFWIIICIYMAVTFGFGEERQPALLVSIYLGKEIQDNEYLFHQIFVLLGFATAVDNIASLILLFVLGRGIAQRDWRKCNKWITGKMYLLTVTLVVVGYIKLATYSIPNNIYVEPDFVVCVALIGMITYRFVAAYIVCLYIKIGQDENVMRKKVVVNVDVDGAVNGTTEAAASASAAAASSSMVLINPYVDDTFIVAVV